ncbi:pyridoxal-phosphate-dependent aminotransferase family protein [Desulfolutivibrio sulfoxidireducens]|uniref:pyridoxal-phosphate-dependent aminotransferase family protein n=1 Tax=Desulfolutivibrio sulfoxidireducens TaxID=2773299 RepID=UPI00159E85A1|nr:aminotransferase class V-fold PLP-dependent enzyme [Desulfolutivibrio sulfoxidireducens]QLA19017.1 aminotransferase class V-fold PLP-dependent enzyme [Desulfolutivibrio sulfoxidireducens]
MKDTPFSDLTLFITGPTYVRPQVRQAGMLPEFGHRDTENTKRFEPIMNNLKTLAGVGDDHRVIIFNGSGSTAMEASIRSLVADGETVLNVSVGAFGDLYHKMAVVNGKKAVQLKFEPGRAMELSALEAAIAEHRPAVVTITHNETSTGVTNDIVAACQAIRKSGALALVDGVSLFGGAPAMIAESGCAMYSTSTQKSLALPAGFGIAFVTAEAVDKAGKVQNRGHSSDILGQLGRAGKFQTLTTPNCTLANQMCVELDYIVNEEGVANRFARHVAMRDMVAEFVAGLPGYSLFAQEGFRSATLTTVLVPTGVSVKDLKAVKEVMRAKGYLYDPGYGKLNEQFEKEGRQPIFRIGHMGDITPSMLKAYLKDLGPALPKA